VLAWWCVAMYRIRQRLTGGTPVVRINITADDESDENSSINGGLPPQRVYEDDGGGLLGVRMNGLVRKNALLKRAGVFRLGVVSARRLMISLLLE